VKLEPYYVFKNGEVYLGQGYQPGNMRTVDRPMDALRVFESDIRLWLPLFPSFKVSLLSKEAGRYPAWEDEYLKMMAEMEADFAAVGG
jgi:hypothetical protein